MDEYMKPIKQDGDTLLEVECGKNKAMMYISKLCQGSKGPCILFQEEWLTPNEFQFVSGRQTAKDWKRSIRHHGKSLKLLLNKGLVSVHPPICDCTGCRQASPKVKSQSAHKKRAPLTAITLPGDAQQKLEAASTEPDASSDHKSALPSQSPSENNENKDAVPPKDQNDVKTAGTEETKSCSRRCKTPTAKEHNSKSERKRQQFTVPSTTPEPETLTSEEPTKLSKPPVAVVAPTLASTAPKDEKCMSPKIMTETRNAHKETHAVTSKTPARKETPVIKEDLIPDTESSFTSPTVSKPEKIKKPSSSHSDSENTEKPHHSTPARVERSDVPREGRADSHEARLEASVKSPLYGSGGHASKSRVEAGQSAYPDTLPLRLDARLHREQEVLPGSLSSDYYRMPGYPSPRHMDLNYLSLLHQYSAAHGNYCKWNPAYDLPMTMLPYPVHPSEDTRLYNHFIPSNNLMYDSAFLNSRMCCHVRPELPAYPYEHRPLTVKEDSSRERSPSPRRSLKRKAFESSAFSCYTPMTSPSLHSTVGLDLSVKRQKLDLHRVY